MGVGSRLALYHVWSIFGRTKTTPTATHVMISIRLCLSKSASRAICLSLLRLRFNLLFFQKEVRVRLKNVLIKVIRLETSHSNVEIGLDDRGDVALIDTEVEGLNIVVV